MYPKTYIVGPSGHAFFLQEVELFPLPRRLLYGCPASGENGQLDLAKKTLAWNIEDPFLKRHAGRIQEFLRTMQHDER